LSTERLFDLPASITQNWNWSRQGGMKGIEGNNAPSMFPRLVRNA